MRSLFVSLKPALRIVALASIMVFQSASLAMAQSDFDEQPRKYTPEQWEQLQEFAQQFRDDPSLFPPEGDASQESNPARKRVPAENARFRIPRYLSAPSGRNGLQDPEQVFDPFKEPEPKQQPAENSVFDPSPDPPVTDQPNQQPSDQETVERPPTQDSSQPRPAPNSNSDDPFNDDRAIDKLLDLEPANKVNPQRPAQRQPDMPPPAKPVDERLLQQWELPPNGARPTPDSMNAVRPAISPDQPRHPMLQQPPRQPRSEVAPYPYQLQPAQPNYSNGQPDQAIQGSLPDELTQAPLGMNPTLADPSSMSPSSQQWLQVNGQGVYEYHQQPEPRYSYYEGCDCESTCPDQSFQQPGKRSCFANPNSQWGVAGIEPCYDSCCSGDCQFDCEIPEFYLSGYGIAAYLRNLDSAIDTLLTDNGGGFGLALGQRQGLNLRTELEYAWRSNSINGDQNTLVNLFDISGKVKSQAGMANAYWEFVNFPTCRLKPYVGAGLGFSRFEVDLQNSVGSLTPERSKDSSFAYQFMGGVNLQPTSYVDLFIEYRLFRADSFQIETVGGVASGRYNYETSNLVGGLRWKF